MLHLDVYPEGYESMNEGMVAFDQDLKLIACNAAYLKVRDLPAELAVVGRDFADIVRHDVERYDSGATDPDTIVERVVALARNSEPHRYERQRPDGSWIEARGGPIAGGGFVSTYADVTERKQAEAEIERRRTSFPLR